MPEPAAMTTWLSAYAALVGTCSLLWQITSWTRSRRPDVTVAAGHESSSHGGGFGINVKIVPSNDVTVVRAGIAPWQGRWPRIFPEMVVRCWAIDGGAWKNDEDGRGLPRGLSSTSVLNIWFSEQDVTECGMIEFKDGRDYFAWVETSKGHIHRSNVFGGDSDGSWKRYGR